jgi:hypothetical protein
LLGFAVAQCEKPAGGIAHVRRELSWADVHKSYVILALCKMDWDQPLGDLAKLGFGNGVTSQTTCCKTDAAQQGVTHMTCLSEDPLPTIDEIYAQTAMMGGT